LSIGGPILRIHNVRQPRAASRSASVFMHEVDVCGHSGYIYHANLRGPGGEYRLLEVPFCEYAILGSPGSHPALLVSSCAKWTYAFMVKQSTVRISEAPGVNGAYLRSHFATQCEAARGRIPLCECLHARSGRKRSWWTYLPCESPRPRW